MDEITTGMFDVSELDPDRTVVRCQTQEEADLFLDYLQDINVWGKRHIESLKKQWCDHGSSTCYHLSQSKWCYDSWYAQNYPEYKIIDFSDIYKGCQQREMCDFAYGFEELFL